MRNLFNLTNEEIAEFLLNGKTANGLELAIDPTTNPSSSFTNRTIYKDNVMEIIYSYLILEEDDVIEQFYIYSSWWGSIKNSFFTCQGVKGKSKERKCCVINLQELKNSKSNTSHPINNKNQVATIVVHDFNSLVAYHQRKHRSSPSYVVISSNPDEVKIQINIDGKKYFETGVSKKDAANIFALKYANINNLN